MARDGGAGLIQSGTVRGRAGRRVYDNRAQRWVKTIETPDDIMPDTVCTVFCAPMLYSSTLVTGVVLCANIIY